MGIPRKIRINDGKSGKQEYYYWDEFDTWEEASYYAKKIKKERREMGEKIKYFILESEDSWFLPVTKFVLYLNKKLRLL